MRDGRVEADDLRGDHGHRFRDHRIHLAGHDAAARLQRRQLELGEARERAAAHPAQVVRDFHQRDGERAQLAGKFDRRVLARQRREVVRRRRERQAGQRRAAPR